MPILRGVCKWLIISDLVWFWRKSAFVEKKKSTTFENLALTFENLACLQKREKQQNLSKKRAQKQGPCAILRLLRPDFSSGNGSTRLENALFSLQNASSPWTKFSVKDFDILEDNWNNLDNYFFACGATRARLCRYRRDTRMNHEKSCPGCSCCLLFFTRRA